jgi:hypothetical protein
MVEKKCDTDVIISILKTRQDLVLDKGLSDDEIGAIELRYGFKFPIDLRKLIQKAIPIGMI